MKKLFFLFLLSPLLLFAQSETELIEENSFDSSMAIAVENLDFSEVTTDLLWDRSAQLFPIDLYLESQLNDSIYMNDILFGLLYASFYSASIDTTNRLPEPDVAYTNVVDTISEGDPIPVAMILQRFHRFKENVVSNNLIDTLNGQLYDVVNRPESPYFEDTLFVATPLVSNIYSSTTTFYFSNNFIFNNTDYSIDSLWLDLGEGSGLEYLEFEEGLRITFSQGGNKYFTIKCKTSNGLEFYSKAIFQLPEFLSSRYDVPPDLDYPIEATALHSGAILNVFYACPEKKLKKPVLVIEGADPPQTGNSWTYADMIELLAAEPENNPGKKVWDLLDEGEVDLIYMDFNHGTDDMRRNAEAVKDALDWINSEKTANGSSEKNIVIGVSMGGPIGKWALLELEAAGIDHDTKKYIAFDAPMRGNNFSLGLQHMFRHLSNMTIMGKKLRQWIPVVDSYQSIFFEKANKQMLYYHAFYLEGPGETPTYPDYYEYYNALEQKGALQDCEYIAISNGSQLGIKEYLVEDGSQLFDPGAKLFDIEGHIHEGALGGIFPIVPEFGISDPEVWGVELPLTQILLAIDANIDFDVWSLPPQDEPSKVKIYRGSVLVEIADAIPIVISHYKYKTKGLIPLDSAPGGASQTVLGLIQNLENSSQIMDMFIDVDFNATCFVPIVSALDLKDPENEDVGYDLSDNEDVTNSGITAVKRFVASNDDDVPAFGLLQHNQKHPSLNKYNSVFLIDELLAEEEFGINISPLNDRTYNYGLEDDLDYNVAPLQSDLTIELTGKLWINRDDRIGYIDDTSNPQNTINSHLNVHFNSFCNESLVNIVVQNGGEFIIGEWDNVNNTGDVYLNYGSTMTIKSGGFAEVEQNSKIIVKDGGKIKVESGGRLRAVKGGQIIVEEGGTLEIDGGAFIDMHWNESNIHVKGELIINGTFVFDGYGYFQFDETHNLTLNADFVLSGQGSRFIRLNPNTTLKISNRLLDLYNGDVEYDVNTSILIQGGAVQVESVAFNGLASTPNDNMALQLYGATQMNVIGCAFNTLSNGLWVDNGFTPATLNVYNSDFVDVETGISAHQLENLLVNGSDFQAGNYGLIAISLDDVQSGGVFSSTINDYVTNGADIGALYLWNVDEISLLSTEVNDNEVGIYLEDVTKLRIHGGEINNNSIAGIYAPVTAFSGGSNQSNVFLYDKAQVNDNAIGIHIEKGGINTGGGLQNAYYGLVLMDCAELKNNTTGILGEDVTLQIDAFINAGSTDPLAIRPNKIHGTGLYLDICYDDLAPYVEEVPAKGNYWGGSLPASGKYKVNNGTPTALCGTFGGILDASNFVTTEPTTCDDGGLVDPSDPELPPLTAFPGFTGDPDDECTFIDGGGSWEIHQEFLDAYTYFRAGWYSDAELGFNPIASVPDSTHLQSDAACKHYINVAKAMAPASAPLQFSSSPGSTEEENHPTSTQEGTIDQVALVIYPNPARSEFSILLDIGNYRVKVLDPFGSQQLNRKVQGNTTIKVSDWPTGLYFIQVYNEKSKSYKNGKLLIY